MKIQSNVVSEGQPLDSKYTCSAEDQSVSPPLSLLEIPEKAKSLAIVLEDQESGDVTRTNYWFVFNIDPTQTSINEEEIPSGAIVGTNSFGEKTYTPPCPPENDFRDFRFIAYALKEALPKDAELTYEQFQKATKDTLIETATFWVRVDRPSSEIRYGSEQAVNELSSFTNEPHK